MDLNNFFVINRNLHTEYVDQVEKEIAGVKFSNLKIVPWGRNIFQDRTESNPKKERFERTELDHPYLYKFRGFGSLCIV